MAIKPTLVFIIAIIVNIGCSNHCPDNFIKEVKDNSPHKFFFDARTVYEKPEENTTLTLKGEKGVNGDLQIDLIFNSHSDHIHLSSSLVPDTKLHIKVGDETVTYSEGVYIGKKNALFDETIKYTIPVSVLKDLIKKWYNVGGEMYLSNYRFTITNELACCLGQLAAK